MSDDFREELRKTQIPNETQWQRPNPQADYADIIHSRWAEEWITKDDDLFDIILRYYFPDKGYGNCRIWCDLMLFTPSSWQYKNVLRYKQNHPELFKDSNETNEIKQKSPGG